MKIDFKGWFPATVLPMTEAAQIDEPALRAYRRHVADTMIHGVAINVQTGETAHLGIEPRTRRPGLDKRDRRRAHHARRASRAPVTVRP